MAKIRWHKKSIVTRLTFFVVIIIVIQTVLLVGSLIAGGVLDQAEKNAYQAFYEKVNNEFFVLEIKFVSGFPDWLQKILFSHKLTRKSFSKYAESVDEIICLTRNSSFTDLKYRTIHV